MTRAQNVALVQRVRPPDGLSLNLGIFCLMFGLCFGVVLFGDGVYWEFGIGFVGRRSAGG